MPFLMSVDKDDSDHNSGTESVKEVGEPRSECIPWDKEFKSDPLDKPESQKIKDQELGPIPVLEFKGKHRSDKVGRPHGADN